MSTLKRPPNNNSLRGRIVCEQSKPFKAGLYTIAGLSYDSFVLVQLFEQTDMNAVLYRKCYKVLRPLAYRLPTGVVSLTEYADTTNIISRDISCLEKLVDAPKSSVAHKLHKTDIAQISSLICSAATIPAHIKSKYFEPA